MLSGEGNENGEKTTIGLIQLAKKKNNFACTAHLFCTFLCLVLHDHNVKLPETSLSHVLWRKRYTCCSLFFTRSFLPWWPLGFLLFSPLLKIFMLFFQQITPYLPL